MDKQDFLNSFQLPSPPPGLSVCLQSLWYDANDHWDKAHELIQDLEDVQSAAMHAYLHRKEGDQFNANYWYRRAVRKPFEGSLKEEFESLVQEFLSST